MRGNCHQNKNLRIVSILFDFLNFNLVKSLYCTVLYCTALYQTELHCILPAIVECQLNLPLFSLSHCKNNVLLLILLCQCQCLNFWQYILFESTPILTYLVISESLILLFNIVIWKIKIQKQCNEYSKCRQMEAFHTSNDLSLSATLTIASLLVTTFHNPPLATYIIIIINCIVNLKLKKYILSFIIISNY